MVAFDSLKAFLELHHERLTSFDLDFIHWEAVEDHFNFRDNDDDDDYYTPLIGIILPRREADYEDFMPNLQTFSLSAASFRGSWDCLIDAFNLRNVKELRLLSCKQTVKLLDSMALTDTKSALEIHIVGQLLSYPSVKPQRSYFVWVLDSAKGFGSGVGIPLRNDIEILARRKWTQLFCLLLSYIAIIAKQPSSPSSPSSSFPSASSPSLPRYKIERYVADVELLEEKTAYGSLLQHDFEYRPEVSNNNMLRVQFL